ncbi:MAG: hypothetical protein N2662_10355 [Bacteroidales bacterium]|nr:hypothetical protein [Bacteroidales bacterium]
MKFLKYLFVAAIIIILIVFSISYIVWLGYPKTHLNVYVLDKTVPDFKYEKHKGLFWVLNNARIVKSNGKSYKIGYDYYGFHPLRPLSDYQYEIKRILLEQIDSISDHYDVAYYTDTRGVYFNEWFKGFRRSGENSVIEGGLNQNDYLLLKTMKEKGKLIIGEFDILGSPTSDLISYKTEQLFKIHSTGWKGKYFKSLDSSNTEIPYYVIEQYRSEHEGQWSYSGEGIILTNNRTTIVLEANKHLNVPYPVIVNDEMFRSKFQLPMSTDFVGWFEIVAPSDSVYIAANFQLNLTSTGDSILNSYGLSSIFPAVIIDNSEKIRTCYFAGDFATNQISTIFSQMANSSVWLKNISTNKHKIFFQKYYFPLLENMLKKYAQELNRK